MKKLLALLVVLLIAVTMTVSAQVAITLAADATTSDLLLEGSDFGLGLDTGITAEFGETGLSASVTLNKTLMPEFSMDYVTIEEAYAYTLGEVDLELSNENKIDINSDIEEDMGGIITLDATWKFVNAGFDFGYAPETAFDIYFGPTYTGELGKGTLDLNASLVYNVDPIADIMGIYGEAMYTMPAGPTEVYFGVLPAMAHDLALDEYNMELKLEAGVSYAF